MYISILFLFTLTVNTFTPCEVFNTNNIQPNFINIIKSYQQNYKICEGIIQINISDIQHTNEIVQEHILIDLQNKYIQVKNYQSLVRALEHLDQYFFVHGDIPDNYFYEHSPYLKHRGLMIDSARHFLPVTIIKHIIDGLRINNLNVLHWHLSDNQSVPIDIQKYPEILKHSKFSEKEFYSDQDIQNIIQYAKENAVVIIPELDTPGHMQAWGLNDETKDIIVQPCRFKNHNHIYNYGQLDPTMKKTYEFMNDVLQQISNQFPSQYVHLGMDEVQSQCWDSRQSIKQYMKTKGIKDYKELQQIYLKQITKQLGDINANKKAITWAVPDNSILPEREQDIIQFWGNNDQLKQFLQQTKNQVITSPYDYLYFDTGINGPYGDNYNKYVTNKELYQYNPVPEGFEDRILGAEACLWSEERDVHSIDTGLFMRLSFAANTFYQKQKSDFKTTVFKMNDLQKYMRSKGFKTIPIMNQWCEDEKNFNKQRCQKQF